MGDEMWANKFCSCQTVCSWANILVHKQNVHSSSLNKYKGLSNEKVLNLFNSLSVHV